MYIIFFWIVKGSYALIKKHIVEKCLKIDEIDIFLYKKKVNYIYVCLICFCYNFVYYAGAKWNWIFVGLGPINIIRDL